MSINKYAYLRIRKNKSVNTMLENKNDYCVILAGGKGRRLWPCSREDCPKQFIDFFSTGRTQIQQTYDRMSKFIPAEKIYICTNKEYTHYVEEQLPEVNKQNILSEPVARNTAPSVAWAAYRIGHLNRNARMVVVPSDQAVFKEEEFERNVLDGLNFVGSNNCLLTMGVKPTRPEPGYGYIQLGEESAQKGVYKVKSFTEKPDRDFAKMFMESGEFYWNTGLFLSNVLYLGKCLKGVFPIGAEWLEKEHANGYSMETELQMIEQCFPACPNLSIDYGILDKNENVYVMQCDFGWADLGMWHSIYESMSRAKDDNVVIASHALLDNSKGNIVKLPDDHMGIISGLEGYIVAEKGNVLLVCKKEDSSALIRKYINEVQVKYGDEFI